MSHQRDFSDSGTGPGTYYCEEGVPVELGLLTILAAFGVAFGVLYRGLTLKTGRRRRRSEEGSDDQNWEVEGCKDLESKQDYFSKFLSSAWLSHLIWHNESFKLIFFKNLWENNLTPT